jgi:MFS family permease
VLARYRLVLGVPGVPALLGATLLSGVGSGIYLLGLVLLVADATGSFAQAGIASAAYGVGIAVTAPVRGRLVDRLGQRRVIVPLALLDAVAAAALVLAAAADAGLAAFAPLAALAGAATPPLMASLRALWADLIADDDARTAAYGVQSVLLEAFSIGGPLLAAGLAALAGPAVAVAAAGGLEAAGGLLFAATAASRSARGAPAAPGARFAGALSSPGLRVLAFGAMAGGAGLGALEVAVPAFADVDGDAAAGGIALAALAAGSLIGTVVYAGRSWPGRRDAHYPALVALTAAALVLPALATSLAVLAVLLLVAALALGPVTAVVFALLDDVAERATAAEATTWVITTYALGSAAGAALAGAVAEAASPRTALLLAPAFLAGELAVVLSRRSALRPALAGS